MIVIGAIGLVFVGTAILLIEYTREASATISLNILTSEDLRVYEDEGLTEEVGQLDFGEMEVDVFGTVVQPSAISIWIHNRPAILP